MLIKSKKKDYNIQSLCVCLPAAIKLNLSSKLVDDIVNEIVEKKFENAKGQDVLALLNAMNQNTFFIEEHNLRRLVDLALEHFEKHIYNQYTPCTFARVFSANREPPPLPEGFFWYESPSKWGTMAKVSQKQKGLENFL